MTVLLLFKDGKYSQCEISEHLPSYRMARVRPILSVSGGDDPSRMWHEVIEFKPSGDYVYWLRETGVAAMPVWKEQ